MKDISLLADGGHADAQAEKQCFLHVLQQERMLNAQANGKCSKHWLTGRCC